MRFLMEVVQKLKFSNNSINGFNVLLREQKYIEEEKDEKISFSSAVRFRASRNGMGERRPEWRYQDFHYHHGQHG
jgi:hypothetical protein